MFMKLIVCLIDTLSEDEYKYSEVIAQLVGASISVQGGGQNKVHKARQKSLRIRL